MKFIGGHLSQLVMGERCRCAAAPFIKHGM